MRAGDRRTAALILGGVALRAAVAFVFTFGAAATADAHWLGPMLFGVAFASADRLTRRLLQGDDA